MTPQERAAFLVEVEHFIAANGMTDADAFKVSGYALRFDSTAHGERGPTKFSSRALGSNPISVPLLWNHDSGKPIGRITVTPDGVGLRAEGRISDTAFGRDVVQLLRDGSTNGISVGFTTATSHKDKDGTRIIDSATLQECSLVCFPADASARVSSVGGQAVPQFHAAPAHERGTTTATDTVNLAREKREREIAEAESFLTGGVLLHDEAAPAVGYDLWGRVVPAPTSMQAWERQQARRDAAVWKEAQREWATAHPVNLSKGAW